jgi:hypothetical protein
VKRSTKSARRYYRASGAPFSDEDAQIIGEALQKIAEANRIGDIRTLDKKIVFKEVERDPKHPLRKFYDWDVRSAARKHWIDHTALIIRSIRVEIRVGRNFPAKRIQVYESAEVPRLDHQPQRKRVLIDDVLTNDPIFADAIGRRIRRIDTEIQGLETLTSCRKTSAPIARFLESIRSAMDAYLGEIGSK